MSAPANAEKGAAGLKTGHAEARLSRITLREATQQPYDRLSYSHLPCSGRIFSSLLALLLAHAGALLLRL
jgi:hypothetical protein